MDDTARQAALADLYTFPGHLLWRAAAKVSAGLDRVLPDGTDLHGYAVLVALGDGEPQSQRSLADMTGVSGTTMTSVAQALQRDGLVERVRNPEDRRSYSLTRTSSGRAAVRRWATHVAQLETRITASFTAEDAARLREILVLLLGDQLDQRTPKVLLDSTGFLVNRAHQRAHREFLADLEPLGIEPRHVGTLRALRIAGPTTQGEVGALLDVSPATVVQMVDHLEQRGLVTRERDAADRRAYRLLLTPAAVQVLAEATEMASVLLGERIGGPRSRAHRDLVRLLPRLLEDASRP